MITVPEFEKTLSLGTETAKSQEIMSHQHNFGEDCSLNLGPWTQSEHRESLAVTVQIVLKRLLFRD